MNLWVRSQYKEMLFKVNNNLIIRHNDNVENGMYFIECDSCKIAMYKTREKALKVLDEIQDLLQNAYIENANRIVYKMPED